MLALTPGSGAEPAERVALGNAPIAAWQEKLLDMAFDTASAMPVRPHLKNRSRAQYEVVAACLELGQSARAAAYAELIGDWRRGMAYADLAYDCARRGITAPVQPLLDRAGEIAELSEDWRRDRIRVRIGQTHFLLGQAALAGNFAPPSDSPEDGRLADPRAAGLDDAAFAARMQHLDEHLARGGFDLVKNVLHAYVGIYESVYLQADRRTAVATRIRESWSPLPILVRLELLGAMTEVALKANDTATALELVDAAQKMFDEASWPTEYRISLGAGLVKLRARAGDSERGRRDADAMLALFDNEGETIVDIFRGRALRPLAEAYQSLGQGAKALAVYERAVVEGAKNPNSRPRAQELCAICCSLARHGVEPTPELREHMATMRRQLGDPW